MTPTSTPTPTPAQTNRRLRLRRAATASSRQAPVQSKIHHMCNFLIQSNLNPSRHQLDWIERNPCDRSKFQTTSCSVCNKPFRFFLILVCLTCTKLWRDPPRFVRTVQESWTSPFYFRSLYSITTPIYDCSVSIFRYTYTITDKCWYRENHLEDM